MKILNDIRAVIDQIASWIKWGLSIAFLVFVLVYVLEVFGVHNIALPSPQVMIYIAGIWWLTR